MIVKNLNFGNKAREQVFKGITKLTQAVSSTLGASGKCVLLEDANGNPIFIGLPVKGKSVGPDFTTLVLDISDGALGSDGSAARANITQLATTKLSDLEGVSAEVFAGAKVGIRNTFSIAKGRIII